MNFDISDCVKLPKATNVTHEVIGSERKYVSTVTCRTRHARRRIIAPQIHKCTCSKLRKAFCFQQSFCLIWIDLILPKVPTMMSCYVFVTLAKVTFQVEGHVYIDVRLCWTYVKLYSQQSEVWYLSIHKLCNRQIE